MTIPKLDSRRAWIATACLILPAACGSAETPASRSARSASAGATAVEQASPATRRDSAGVTIVESPTPATGPADRWTVSAEPVLSLGVQEGGGPQQFAKIGGVTRLSNGDVVVLETQSEELRFFDSRGSAVRTVGGGGDGPGELRWAQTLRRLPGDTLAVWDLGRQALNLFSSKGKFIRRSSMQARVKFPDAGWSQSIPATLPILPDGSVLDALGAGRATDADPNSTGLHRSVVRLARVPRALDHLDTLGLYRGQEAWLVRMGKLIYGGAADPLMPKPFVAVGASPPRLYVANNPEYSIEGWNPNGHLDLIIRRRGARRAPTDEERTTALDITLHGYSGARRARATDVIGRIDSVPAVMGLAVGPNDELWVKRGPVLPREGPASFDVFDGSGAFEGSVHVPVDFDLREVGRDYLLGITKDSLDVPYVKMYRLERGAG